MKKYILLSAIAIAAVFTSCSNDDVEVSKSITFKLNPATVVSNLYERNAGDLTALSGGSKLIVTLFVYDEKGALVNKTEKSFSAYTHMMNADVYLPAGKYTAVATTHVTSDVNYWTLSGTEQLSTFQIKDNGYIGGKSKILGLSIKSFVIDNDSETFNINIENAGAVALVWFYNWNKYTDVKEYSLMGKQACDYVSFDNFGNKDYSIKSESTYKFYKVLFEYDSDYSSATAYFFTFPIRNASFRFYAKTTDGQSVAMSKEFVDDVKQGESYAFVYDFVSGGTDEANWYDMTPSATRSNSGAIDLDKYKFNENDRIMYDYEGGSISIR